MKKHISILLLTMSASAFAQEGRVGINTTSPKTTMDVSGKTANQDGSGTVLATDMTGLQAPRLTRQELSDKGDSLYGADQKGALVYITDVSGGSAASQRVNITSVGYYYFDGLFWQKFVFGSDGMDKTDDEWVNDPANTRIHLGKKSDGVTARDAGTEVVVLDNGRVGIGTNTPTGNLQVVNPIAVASGEFGDRVAFKSGHVIINHHNDNKRASYLGLYKSRAGQNVNPGDDLGDLMGLGYIDNANTAWGKYKRAASITFKTDGAKNLSTSTEYIPGIIEFLVGNETSNLRGMWFTSNGNLGINMSLPAAKLHIVKAAGDLTPAIIVGCNEYTDNTAATTAGLPIGALYRTGDVLKVVH